MSLNPISRTLDFICIKTACWRMYMHWSGIKLTVKGRTSIKYRYNYICQNIWLYLTADFQALIKNISFVKLVNSQQLPHLQLPHQPCRSLPMRWCVKVVPVDIIKVMVSSYYFFPLHKRNNDLGRRSFDTFAFSSSSAELFPFSALSVILGKSFPPLDFCWDIILFLLACC